MPRPTRPHKPHASHRDGEGHAPLDHADELRRLLCVYEDCPGIAADLAALITDLDQRRKTDAA